MTRRKFVAASGSLAALSASAATPDTHPAIFELTRYQLRNSAENQGARLPRFLEQSLVPALKRHGAGTIGVFRNSISADGPFVITLVSHASMAAYEATAAKLATDAEFRKQEEAFYGAPEGLAYERAETSLLRAFGKVPAIEVPPAKEGGRIFELRRYESNTPLSLARKVEMFETGGEIAIFRKCGLLPVFFATTVVGTHLPNLTYMVAFDSLAAREQAWKKFSASPEWQELRAKPGLGDAAVVSNISNCILTASPGSDIR